MEVNPIVLPSWLNNKCVFQQNLGFRIEGYAAPSATITLEISKDPTDGRRVSKLDTEYGVIFSQEKTTSAKGKFVFEIPAYKASTDTYTFVFKCFTETLTIQDIRCGDVWIFLGGDLLAVPIKNAKAPGASLKRNNLNLIRLFTPSRSGLEEGEKEISYKPKTYYKNAEWIRINDTAKLADASSSAFAFAYNLADQIHYPVGIVDLSFEDSSIVNWISGDAVSHNEALKDYLDRLGFYLDEETYVAQVNLDKQKEELKRLKDEVKEGKNFFDFDFAKQERIDEIEGGTPITETTAGLDFPGSKSSKAAETSEQPSTSASNSSKALDFEMANAEKTVKTKVAETKIENCYRLSTLFNAKLAPLDKMPIRGICYATNKNERDFERYDLLFMGFLESLISVFEPKEAMNESDLPSLLLVTMHPDCVDFENPYKVIEFNENLTSFKRRLTMPTGIVSCHDLLLVDKEKSYILGTRLSVAALGIHFSPKMAKSCPECTGCDRAGNKLILTFDNIADGLKLSEGESVLRGFAVCGKDRIFYPAKARILHGVRVMVWRDDIDEPESVSYGFSPFPEEATFRNVNDLPVLPFRFDRDPAFYAPSMPFATCDKLTFVGKKDEASDFENLTVFKNFKGNGVISLDTMNKTEGSASLHIRYETENSLYGFEPDLKYASLMAPIELQRRSRVLIDVFNPDSEKKKLSISGFKGEADIQKQLSWQTLVFENESGTGISLEDFKITVFDSSRTGEIYIDNIRFN